jgi:amidase
MTATELVHAGAAEQARLVREGGTSARELADATLRRIEALDPALNAYRVVLRDEALAAADEADARRRAGEQAPLLGVPVCIKDDTDMVGQATARGSAAAHPGPVAADAEVVARLRRAGAVIVGKTLVPEVTLLPATDTTTFGASRNPWDLSRTPGGSSGGTAAAVAAGLAGVGLGSDGAGSIRNPAAWCGLFGFKPSRGCVPDGPREDAWQGLSVYGPIARTVPDAALFLDATADRVPDGGYAAAAAADPARLRVAVTTKTPPGALPHVGREERAAVATMARLLRELGHEVVDRDPDWPAALPVALYVRVLRGVHDDVTELAHPERLEPRTRRVAALGTRLPARLVRWARAVEPELSARITSLWRDADVLLCPAATDGPYVAGEVGRWGAAKWLLRAGERLSFYAPFNLTGQPACTIPAGMDDDGLPMAVQLVGRHDDEETLISLSAQIERSRPWAGRRPEVA